MKKNKLLSYFEAFSTEEYRQFEQFISTPFFNMTRDINRLFDCIQQSTPTELADKNWKQNVFAYVFPNVEYKDGQVRTLFWRMTKLIETFLAVNNMMNDKDRQEEQLILALAKNESWFRLFEKKIKSKTKTKNQEGKNREVTNLLQSIKLHHQLYFHPDFSKYGSGVLEILNLIHDLDEFIILAKLKYHSELLFRKQILNEGEELGSYLDFLVDQILANENIYVDVPVIILYIKLIRMKQSGEWEQYLSVKKYFQQFNSRISLEDQQGILQYLMNFIIHINRQEDSLLYGEMLELYIIGLDSGFLHINNRMTYETFTNIAIIGSTEKRFAWTDVFIRKYQQYLESSKAGLAVKMARAFWSFHQQNYEQVLDWTKDIDMNEEQPDSPFRLKALKLRAYYELSRQEKSYLNLLHPFIVSFSKFIKNNKKLARQQALAYLNFVRMVKLLLKTYGKENLLSKAQKQSLLVHVGETSPMALKKWVIEKIEES